jgi:hypothetical protein
MPLGLVHKDYVHKFLTNPRFFVALGLVLKKLSKETHALVLLDVLVQKD